MYVGEAAAAAAAAAAFFLPEILCSLTLAILTCQ